MKKIVKKTTKKKVVKKTAISDSYQAELTAQNEAKKREELANEIEFKEEKKGKHLFQPGQSGNPNGRTPGRVSLSTVVKNILIKEKDPATGIAKIYKLGDVIVDLALKGNPKMIELTWNYIDGKPNQPISTDPENAILPIEDQRRLLSLLEKNKTSDEKSTK